MGTMARLLAVSGLAILACSVATSSPITINGDDSDWTSPLSSTNDANGDVTNTGYDIDFSYTDYDEAADRLAFMAQTVAPISNTNGADFVEFVFNADDNVGTGDSDWHGCVGADFRFEWDLDGTEYTAYDYGSTSHKPLFWTWNSGSWTPQFSIPANDLHIAWGDNAGYSIIECTLNPNLIGNPKEFAWVCYLDDGGTSADDTSLNRVTIEGDDSPEPATWVLIACTVAVGALRRRRG